MKENKTRTVSWVGCKGFFDFSSVLGLEKRSRISPISTGKVSLLKISEFSMWKAVG